MVSRPFCFLRSYIVGFLILMFGLFLSIGAAKAQTTSFTYQGRLTDGGNAANGTYDLQFALFDTSSSGTQIGSTLTRSAVSVSGGIFTVQLDFTVNAFPGADRFLEIGVRPAAGGSFAILSPRQQISSTPYAIRTLSATTADSLSSACVGCVQDAQINAVAGSKVTGTIPAASVPDLSASYIKNTTSQQGSSNFNISGNGTAGGTLNGNAVNVTTQFNIGGARVLSAPGNFNLFAGLGAGQANTSGANNAFLGAGAGQANTIGSRNAFFGFNAGRNNPGDAFGNGSDNAFFGSSAGSSNVGQQNSFFGSGAGAANSSGNFNSFFGEAAGLKNSNGGGNTFIGSNTGFSSPGPSNTSGSNDTALGLGAMLGLDADGNNVTNATAIGANSFANRSNTLVLGSISGVNGATADTLVGVGTASPSARFHVVQSGDFQLRLENTAAGGGFWNIGQSDNSFLSGGGKLLFVPNSINSNSAAVAFTTAGNVGIGTPSPTQRLHINNSSGNAAALVQTPSGSFAQYQLQSGATNPWIVGTQNDFANNALLFRNGSTDLLKLQPNGDISQLPAMNGLVKAMLLVNSDGSINLCYNSQLTGAAATTLPCGFIVSHPFTGVYAVTFPFQVNSRFFSATIGDVNATGGAQIFPTSTTDIQVVTNGGYSNNRVYILVF